MPRLYKNKITGRFYTRTVIKGRMVTQQITDEGADFLHSIGLEDGDDLDDLYWELIANGWTYTRGEFPGGTEIDPEPVSIEPLTIPCDGDLTTVPRFLYASHTSVYYTILHVENSSDYWLQVPVLIKHHGAMELLQLGAVVGQEFTETGLKLLFENRWGYFDEARYDVSINSAIG